MANLSHGLRGQRQGAGTAIGRLPRCVFIPITVSALYLHRIMWQGMTDKGTGDVGRFGTAKGESFAFDAELGLDEYQGSCMGLISFETWMLASPCSALPLHLSGYYTLTNINPALMVRLSLCGRRLSNIHLVRPPPVKVSNTSVSVMFKRGVHSNSASPLPLSALLLSLF